MNEYFYEINCIHNNVIHEAKTLLLTNRYDFYPLEVYFLMHRIQHVLPITLPLSYIFYTFFPKLYRISRFECVIEYRVTFGYRSRKLIPVHSFFFNPLKKLVKN